MDQHHEYRGTFCDLESVMMRGVAILLLCGSLSAAAYNTPIGIPDPGTNWGILHPIDTAKPTRATIAPGWFEATPRVNSIAAGDAHDCYYIDATNGAATDTSNTYGSPTTPRLTVPSKTYSAGSYIEVHGNGATGSSLYSGTFVPAGVGSATNPIWFVGINQPIFSGKLDLGNGNLARVSYLLFDGIQWSNGSKIDMRPRFTNNVIDHIAFRNCSILGTRTNAGTGGISIGSAAFDPSQVTSEIVIYNCDIGWAGNKSAPAEECGVYPTLQVSNLWVLDSLIHDNAEDGFAGSHGGQRTSTRYYIGRDQIYSNVSNGIDIKQMGKVVISECDIRDAHLSTPNQTGSGEAIVLHYSGDSVPGTTADTWKDWPSDVSVLFCTIHDSDFGIVCSTIDTFRAIGNVFYNCNHSTTPWDPTSSYATGTAIHLRGSRMDTFVANNTIYNCDNGIESPDTWTAYNATNTYWHGSIVGYSNANYACILDAWPVGVSNVPPTDTTYWREAKRQIWGNIVCNRAEPTGRDIYLSATMATNALAFDYNLISTNGGSVSYGASTVRNLAWVQANTPHQAHGLSGDPLLVNPAGLNFGLQATSPAIGASTEGIGTTAYSSFAAVFGITILSDRLGRSRPIGLWDMGAYEYLAQDTLRGHRLNAVTFRIGR